VSRAALDILVGRFPDGVIETHAFRGDETAVVRRANVKEILKFLRDDPETSFEMLADLTCVDYLGKTPRFEVVYHLHSLTKRHRLRIKAGVPEEAPTIDTVTDLWLAAGWLEREVWDLYGVRFEGHPDLRRILLYEEFVGHPLRKDYPTDKRQPLVRRPDLDTWKKDAT
jgi:NADH-quinone oxidoreductase subunit C